MTDEKQTQEQADEEMINQGFQELLDSYLATKHRKKVEIITKAFNFAKQAHKGVKRRSGEPYIMHPIAVAKIVCTEIGLGSTSICSALLHDVVEDTPLTFADLRERGVAPEVIEALKLLTHDESVPYLEYVRSLKPNPLARAVKLADLRHNSDLSRLPRITEKDQRRAEKYAKAIAVLEGEGPEGWIDGRGPEGAN